MPIRRESRKDEEERHAPTWRARSRNSTTRSSMMSETYGKLERINYRNVNILTMDWRVLVINALLVNVRDTRKALIFVYSGRKSYRRRDYVTISLSSLIVTADTRILADVYMKRMKVLT